MKIKCVCSTSLAKYKEGQIYDFEPGKGILVDEWVRVLEHVNSFEELNEESLAKFELVEEESDQVNHPTHYNVHQMECIEEMIVAFGVEATINFCVLNAWKYRYRSGSKGCAEQDLEKSDWYMNKAKELREIKND